MLRQLLSSSDNGQNMVIYTPEVVMNHAPSVVIIIVSMVRDGTIIHPLGMNHAPSVVII